MWSPHTRFKDIYSDVFKSYSDILKSYSGILELDLPKVEFYAFFFFLTLIGYNLILIKSSFETGARAYIVWKQGQIAKFFF